MAAAACLRTRERQNKNQACQPCTTAQPLYIRSIYSLRQRSSLTHAAAEKKGLSFDTNRNERSHLRGLWIVIVIVIVIVIGPEDPPASCVDETEGGGGFLGTLCVGSRMKS